MPHTLVRPDSGILQLRLDRPVLLRPIPFHAICEQHLLPFYGVVHIGYLRGDQRLSQAELTRVVEACAIGVQVQDKMTTRIGLWLHHQLAPRGLGVLVEGGYACTPVREGAALAGPTTTMAFYGTMRDNANQQREFITLATRKKISNHA
ncbi:MULTISPECIES: GTP cyclohydrolase I [unclassified Mycobacterium]|uniref:GTP cyclohydrolase I n=1 Tax=unclassified Mycobacterium TaxID=2642494 RepID=UPI0026A999AC|nr:MULTISPECIES: GTP cyclohydrolase I [unclassified Mycobacterium]MDP7706253.1 GTP cyclohydrolase I [Mycobacterium sp. TY815]MDP7725977.1 GTP cyclohydrolase I [Mycobacterium sp. TY814]